MEWLLTTDSLNEVVAYAVAALAMADKVIMIAMKTARNVKDEWDILFGKR